MRIAPRLLPVLLVPLVAPLVGCGSVTSETKAGAHDHGHDHGRRPESLHAAVAELTEMRDSIRDAVIHGNPDDAHGPLHEIGELLGAIPELAAETDLPKEEWDAVKAANDELFAAFGAIDKAFHTKDGDKKAAYEGVAEKLEAAIEAIRSRLALTGEDAGSAHADHDHEEHDEDHGHDNPATAASDAPTGDAS